jgi:hypothetical protein
VRDPDPHDSRSRLVRQSVRAQVHDGRRPGGVADEMLGHLERRGYLVRDPDPHDSRSRLTDRGQALETVAWRPAAELIGPDRMTDLVGTLADLATRLNLIGDPTPAARLAHTAAEPR